MKTLIASVGLVMLVVFPALAQPGPISEARAEAIRECNAIARKYPQYLWGNMEIYQYRACMAQRGQRE